MRIISTINKTLIKLNGYEGKNYILCFDNRDIRDIYKTLLLRSLKDSLRLTLKRYDIKPKGYESGENTYYDYKKCEDEVQVKFNNSEDVEKFLHIMSEIKNGIIKFEDTYVYKRHQDALLIKEEEQKFVEFGMVSLQKQLDALKL